MSADYGRRRVGEGVMAESAKIVGLFGDDTIVVGHAPNENVVELCEELLARARAGEIIGLAGVEVYRDMACATVSAGQMVYSRVIGQLEVMQFDLLGRDARDG